ncbi:S-adenosyl-L-methionine-dependent methyltransferase [Coniochaeta hoffmannii]|uniref:S-adenosyl-L-methionine-dependent methyltransferase n=1 Tax=Coniochaeta hoffmannii TaxID=91930 RepID=A0AA38S7X2_9PEZI|nr:S-adenosyl-L-methionine-dependent methyltransferase [Coniochaeta hoffmannii]
MKDSAPVLYPNEQVGKKVTAYSEEHTLSLPKELTDFHAWILETQETANYTISTFQAKALVWLARLAGAKHVLEIGCYLGFSASIWSHAVGPDGTVTGLEFDPEYAKIADSKLAGLGIKNVSFKIGAAADTLKTLTPTVPYDLVFIDADKTGYPTYLSLLLSRSQPGKPDRLLRPGALIVADNVLRRGIVADPSDENPHAASQAQRAARAHYGRDTDLAALDEFNKAVAGSGRIESWLVPLWDGVMVGRLLD